MEDKVRENRLRRTAARRGLVLKRSRRRDTKAVDYGLYWLLEPSGQPVTSECGVPLDQIEQFLDAPHES